MPGLEARPLALGVDGTRGDDVVVAGFPLNGPYVLSPGRVRDVVTAVGEDIYGRAEVTREVYSLRADVRPGNSGGPVLDAAGTVVGVVFARSLDDPATGYAVTLAEAAPVLEAAAGAVRRGAHRGLRRRLTRRPGPARATRVAVRPAGATTVPAGSPARGAPGPGAGQGERVTPGSHASRCCEQRGRRLLGQQVAGARHEDVRGAGSALAVDGPRPADPVVEGAVDPQDRHVRGPAPTERHHRSPSGRSDARASQRHGSRHVWATDGTRTHAT